MNKSAAIQREESRRKMANCTADPRPSKEHDAGNESHNGIAHCPHGYFNEEDCRRCTPDEFGEYQTVDFDTCDTDAPDDEREWETFHEEMR